jgi:CheY-like chemotaxis protein
MNAVGDRSLAEMTVLIADDNRDGADSMAELLNLELGCRTLTAYDGAQALHLAFAERPDVLIVDIRMPGMGGIEVARRIRAEGIDKGAAVRPLLFAMTGQGITGDLAAIDGNFDAAFAKPVDIERLFADLKRHWHGQPARAVDARFEVFGCFARAVREVLPSMAAKQQTVSFDCEDDPIAMTGDEVALRSAMYRLMAGLTDVMGLGFIVLTAHTHVDDAGQTALTMSAAGTGMLAPQARIDHVLARLSLAPEAGEPTRPGSLARVASGVCPNCGGTVFFSSAPGEGALFRLTLKLPGPERAAPPPSASGALAWLIDAGAPLTSVLERRLQRFGWQVRCFAGSSEAIAAADSEPADVLPVLVVLREGADLGPVSVARLNRRLSPHATVVVLAPAGSAMVADADRSALAMRVEPLSPADIGRLTEHALQAHDDADAGRNSAWSNLLRERSRVLVVDDSEVNRIVASGLVRALGYDVVCASDGLDAIEQCKASPPDVVLMDVNMPVLGGIDATRRLRELQASGRVAPFAIVAATANTDDETLQACRDVGMDGFLSKPLLLPRMHEELRRVTRQAG